MNYDKILKWSETVTVKDLKWLGASIDDVTDEVEQSKDLLKKLKAKHAQLCIARDLNLTHLSPRLSVQCDGKTISVNCLKGQFNDSYKSWLKNLGFKWNKNKLDYVRLAKGVNIDGIREFIRLYESELTTK